MQKCRTIEPSDYRYTVYITCNSLSLETVRKNRLTGSATDSEIEAVAKDWFRFANDRDGGRKKRENKKRDEQGLQGVTEREDRE